MSCRFGTPQDKRPSRYTSCIQTWHVAFQKLIAQHIVYLACGVLKQVQHDIFFSRHLSGKFLSSVHGGRLPCF